MSQDPIYPRDFFINTPPEGMTIEEIVKAIGKNRSAVVLPNGVEFTSIGPIFPIEQHELMSDDAPGETERRSFDVTLVIKVKQFTLSPGDYNHLEKENPTAREMIQSDIDGVNEREIGIDDLLYSNGDMEITLADIRPHEPEQPGGE